MKAKHGGNIYEIAKQYGIDENEILDYSANINPLGIPSKFKETIISRIDVIENYPDPDYKDLVSAIARYNDIDEKFIIPGNGATEIIFQIAQAVKPNKSLLLAPTFLEYERALRRVGSEIEYYFLKENDDFRINKKDFLEKLNDDIDLVVICNPNNPTGQITSKKVLFEILNECKNKDIKLMLDEAFIEFLDNEDENSLMEYLKDYDNLFIIKALTKFFAIPGLRLGYGLMSNPKIRESIINRKEPWTINGFAAISGEVLLGDKDYINRSKEFFKTERKYMYERLKEIKGIKAYEPYANYVFFKLMNEKIMDLRTALIREKILIRQCDNYVNLDNNFFRVAIKDRKSNERLIKALREVLYEG
ncbi:threonine-phosphate decarboxylase CobD [Wukongibacter baidiensis]|uniref:threonine-phosphate decarboxylase CobD n=1 Tax=Wukongibacter baidiensis TaxID=1723361 RepID=UPI003D7F94AE